MNSEGKRTSSKARRAWRAQCLASAGLPALIFLASPAFAQTADASADASASAGRGLGDIVVTAQKRAQNVQDVPIAITALSGDELRDRNITDAQALVQNVPGVIFSSANTQARISIRGISYDGLGGSPAEARVAYHLDGVYLARTSEIYGTFFDIDRVEVLRGPQGTLFGRNAIAGSVSVVSKDPTDEFGGYLQGALGNYNRVRMEGAVGGPIAEGISGRIAFATEDRSGYDYNVTNQTDINDLKTRGFRGKLKFEPTSALTVTLSAEYFQERDKQGQLLLGLYNPITNPTMPGEALGGIAKDGNPRHDFGNVLPLNKRTNYAFSANANYDFGDGLSLVSITGFRHTQNTVNVEVDTTSLPLIEGYLFDRSKQFSEELRLQKSFDRGNLMIGGYYFSENFFTDQNYPLDPAIALFGTPFQIPVTGFVADGIRIGGTSKGVSWAGFAQGDYDITDWLNLTLGARYSWERKKKIGEYFQFDIANPLVWDDAPNPLGPLQFETNTYKNFSPKATLTVKLDEDKSIYATYSKGFRSGGYNLGYNTPGFFPEKLTDYEAGFKAEFFDRRLRVNGAAFIYDYTDLQVNKANATVGNRILNAAGAKLKGVEFEVVALPADGFQIDGSAAFMKSKFTDFISQDPSRPALGDLDLAGNRLPQAPKYTLSYGAQYTLTSELGDFTLRGEGRSLSGIYFDQFNVVENSEKAYTIFNAMLNWKSPDDKLYGGLYIKNITNELTKNGSLVYSGISGFNINGQYDPPRTYGASLGVRF